MEELTIVLIVGVVAISTAIAGGIAVMRYDREIERSHKENILQIFRYFVSRCEVNDRNNETIISRLKSEKRSRLYKIESYKELVDDIESIYHLRFDNRNNE